MNVTVKININTAKIKSRISAAKKRAMHDTSQQALADCNYYCKKDQSSLIDSSQTYSDFENGKLCWNTVYARKQYYLDAARTDINPNARKMWAHHAESVHGKDWQVAFEAALRKHLKE